MKFVSLPILLGAFMFYLRRDPDFPATEAEIEADGGHWVRQSDGRLLEYFKCGKAGGTPAYFQHGYGCTGKLIHSMPDFCESAEELGLEIFSPSQPGFGLSSSYPLDRVRVLAEWPADFALILEKENISGGFFVSGYSAGCVHALTIGNAYADRVLGVGLATPTTPLEVEMERNGGMALPTKFVRMVFVYPYWGDLLGFLMSLMGGRGRMAAPPDVAAALDKMEAQADAGEEIWRTRLNGFVGDQDRGMVKGFRGWADNMAILNEYMDWDTKAFGEKLTKAGRSIIVTSAADDTTNPPVMQDWWIEQLPGAKIMRCREGYGHLHPADVGVNKELLRRMMGKKANAQFQSE